LIKVPSGTIAIAGISWLVTVLTASKEHCGLVVPVSKFTAINAASAAARLNPDKFGTVAKTAVGCRKAPPANAVKLTCAEPVCSTSVLQTSKPARIFFIAP